MVIKFLTCFALYLVTGIVLGMIATMWLRRMVLHRYNVDVFEEFPRDVEEFLEEVREDGQDNIIAFIGLIFWPAAIPRAMSVLEQGYEHDYGNQQSTEKDRA